MDKTEFYEFVQNLIIPLFTGSYLAGEMESTSHDLEVALGKGQTVLLKPTKTDDYRLILKRDQPFKSFEVSIIRTILHEVASISQVQNLDKMYLSHLNTLAIERAIVTSIAKTGIDTILGIISGLEAWGARTYEGAVVEIGILVNLGTTPIAASSDQFGSISYKEIIDKDFFALFSDGRSSFLEIDKDGKLMGYVNLKRTKAVPSVAPHNYVRLANVCGEKRVGIVLTKEHDILIFVNHQLSFARRNGTWCVFSHDEIIRLLANKRTSNTSAQVRRAIYNTALDCSFAYKGACIACVNKESTSDVLRHINAVDIISEKHFEIKKNQELEEGRKLYNIENQKEIEDKFDKPFEEFLQANPTAKTQAIRRIVAGKKLQDLDRKLIEEMTSVDGATLVDYDGTIISVGAIIKIEAGSTGGGRLAATKTLAKYGVAIKVSQDGIMQGYGVDKKGVVHQLFNVG